MSPPAMQQQLPSPQRSEQPVVAAPEVASAPQESRAGAVGKELGGVVVGFLLGFFERVYEVFVCFFCFFCYCFVGFPEAFECTV